MIDWQQPLLWAVLALLGVKTLMELWLSLKNLAWVREHAGAIPEAFQGTIDQETYDKSVAYTQANGRFGQIETVYGALVLVVVLLSGVLPLIWGAGTDLLGTGAWGQALLLALILIGLSLLDLPFQLYHQFVIEARFGFNKSSLGLFIADKIKGIIIGLILGVPLLALLLWIAGAVPFWWLWGFALVFAFQLLLLIIYPQFIMPLFNKFEDLPEGDLRHRLMELADRTGFQAKTILVMDGSKRSAHSNAFFSGFGRFRRIVLFDTLIEQLSQEELEAVLAHEIGHYKLGHIPKLLILNSLGLLVSFGVIGWLATASWFLTTFGFSAEAGIGAVFLLFGLLASILTFWLTPLSARLSRKHEYEADHFAREAVHSPEPLVGALRRLHEKNLSNQTPAPIYSAFYYSHPTLVEREASLRSD